MEPTVEKINEKHLKADWVLNQHVEMVMTIAEGNRTRAARLLGVDRKTLMRWLQRWDLDKIFPPMLGGPRPQKTKEAPKD